MTQEFPVNFTCEGSHLSGILHLPKQAAKRGLLVVVGGPQYRVGSHRQFVLLARDLADAGIAVMRFDYRGMGDSDSELGAPEPCEHVNPDIRAAIDTFFAQASGLEELVIWGLCDGASAALLYAHTDHRVTGVALLNPWVSTEAGAAKAYLKHYYTQRFFSPDLWRKILHGELEFIASVKSLLNMVATTLGIGKWPSPPDTPEILDTKAPTDIAETSPIHERMADGLKMFSGQVLLILSGNDLIAAEFINLASNNAHWRKQLRSPRITRHDFPAADHTFSRRVWRDQVAAWTREWLQSW